MGGRTTCNAIRMIIIDAFATIIGVMMNMVVVMIVIIVGMPVMMIYVITCMMTLARDGAGRASF